MDNLRIGAFVTALATTMLLSVLSCSQLNSPELDKAAIAKICSDELAAFNSKDTDAFKRIFSDDVVVMPSDEPTIEGLAALRTWAKNLNNMFNIQLQYTASEIEVAGNYAFERLALNLTMAPVDGGPAIQKTGKCVHIYKRQEDGSWKIAHDIWNMDSPPAPAVQPVDSLLTDRSYNY